MEADGDYTTGSGIGQHFMSKTAAVIYVERQKICSDGVLRPVYEPVLRETIRDNTTGERYQVERPVSELDLKQANRLVVDRHGNVELKFRGGGSKEL